MKDEKCSKDIRSKDMDASMDISPDMKAIKNSSCMDGSCKEEMKKSTCMDSSCKGNMKNK